MHESLSAEPTVGSKDKAILHCPRSPVGKTPAPSDPGRPPRDSGPGRARRRRKARRSWAQGLAPTDWVRVRAGDRPGAWGS